MKIGYPHFWTSASLRRKRFYSIVAMLIIAVSATVIGFFVPMSTQDAQDTYSKLNQTLTQGTSKGTLPQDIFLNNFPLCLVMFVPVVGFGFGTYLMFRTGQAFSAVFEIEAAKGAATATSASISPTTAIFALVLVGVVFLLEYVSYSIAMTESVWLFGRILQNKLMREFKPLLILIGLIVLLLIVGALVEAFSIMMPF
jgi:hypothetical protein